MERETSTGVGFIAGKINMFLLLLNEIIAIMLPIPLILIEKRRRTKKLALFLEKRFRKLVGMQS